MPNHPPAPKQVVICYLHTPNNYIAVRLYPNNQSHAGATSHAGSLHPALPRQQQLPALPPGLNSSSFQHGLLMQSPPLLQPQR